MLADADYVARALRLAERGIGRTSPNPVVGAVVVSPEGVVVGQGYHQQAGSPHAEVHALNAAGAGARGATLFCNLEPCSHTGRTGPCVERIVEAGIARVVASIEDPNPAVSGAGFRYLREHGIVVDVGVHQDKARRLNGPFLTYVQERRPFVIMKIATSLDGRIAARPGVSTSISSEASARHLHQVRASVDAIAIGSETLLVDDPLLTIRGVWRSRPLRRIVFDRRLRTPPGARLLSTLDAGPVSIVTTASAVADHPERAASPPSTGVEIEAVPAGDLAAAFRRLAERGVMSVLLEGGRRVHAAAYEAGMVDRLLVYVGPVLLGREGVPWLAESELSLASLCNLRARALGSDTLIEGDVHRTH